MWSIFFSPTTLLFHSSTAQKEDLVKMLPKHYDDLMSSQTDTLNEFILHIHHTNVVAPTSDLPRP